MSVAVREKNTFQSAFDAMPRDPAREAAFARFEELGLPTMKSEEWRYTSLAKVAATEWRRAPEAAVLAADVDPLRIPGALIELVFVDGRLRTEHFLGSAKPRDVAVVTIDGIAEPHRLAIPGLEPFTALNAALFEDGARIEAGKTGASHGLIHVIHLATAREPATCAHPRLHISVAEGAALWLIETFASLGDEQHLANAVTEIEIGEGARVEHVKLVVGSPRGFHIGRTAARAAKGAHFGQRTISLGGALVRNELTLEIAGQGVTYELDGLSVSGGDEHIDNRTFVDHAVPHGAGREVYKAVLAGRSSGAFNGKIIVRPDAQKTDAKQTNKSILLSPDATMNTKPQLEIYADDVKCTHGATIGRLDAQQLFYLRARGIARTDAQAMLTRAFAEEVVGRIPSAPVRERIDAVLGAKLLLIAQEVRA